MVNFPFLPFTNMLDNNVFLEIRRKWKFPSTTFQQDGAHHTFRSLHGYPFGQHSQISASFPAVTRTNGLLTTQMYLPWTIISGALQNTQLARTSRWNITRHCVDRSREVEAGSAQSTISIGKRFGEWGRCIRAYAVVNYKSTLTYHFMKYSST